MKPDKSNKNFLLYHAECPDGFGAAWAFWKKYGNDITYIPVKHGKRVPKMPPGSQVTIVDFSYSRQAIEDLRKIHKKVVVIDHHKSAQYELEGLSDTIFNMDKSGAIMAWEYLFDDVPIPTLLRYIQDRDLWQWKLENSREINAFIDTVPSEFFEWEMLSNKLENNFSSVISAGKVVLKNIKLQVDEICSQARIIKFDGHEIPCANSVILQSEIGHQLLQLYPDRPFSVVWHVDDQNLVGISLRSRGDFDVSELARKYGGGGHKAAAGCKWDQIPM